MKKNVIKVIIIMAICVIIISLLIFYITSQDKDVQTLDEYGQEVTTVQYTMGLSPTGSVMGEKLYGYAYDLEGSGQNYLVFLDYLNETPISELVSISQPTMLSSELEGNRKEYWSISAFGKGTENKYYCLISHTLINMENKETISDEWILNSYNESGELLHSVAFSKENILDGYYQIEEGADGNLYILTHEAAIDETKYLYVINKDGELLSTEEYGNYVNMIKTVSGYTLLAHDKEIVILEDNHPYEANLDKIKANDIFACAETEEFDFIYDWQNIVYGYDFETGNRVPLFSMANLEYNLYQTTYMKDGILYTYVNLLNVGPIVIKTMPKEFVQTDEREVLYFATLSDSISIPQEVAEFNISNTQYRIEVLAYGNEENPMQALLQDIMAGKKIDLYDLETIDYFTLVEKDMLADIYPFIDADEEFSREDFRDEILNACEVNGELPVIIPGFYIQTFLVDDSRISEYGGEWNEEVIKTLMQENTETSYREEMLLYLYHANKDKLINETGQSCNFSDGLFEGILESSAQFPSYDESFSMTFMDVLQQRGFISYNISFYDLCVISHYNDMDRGGKLCLMGNLDGNKEQLYLRPTKVLGIGATGEHQDVAWEFVRQFLTYEYQIKYCYPGGLFPMRNDVWEEMYKVITSEEIYENEVVGTIYPYSSNVVFGMAEEDIVIGPADLDVIPMMDACLEHCVIYIGEDAWIWEIITEEAKGFYSGQKSAAAVCESIQSRINIYMKEQDS
ncbi:MAG: hypothetical protein E7284_04450 [Lachnospiraceae bacterium]|nr:hypothetical protein [Lachnospiraceae bacterium]